MNLITNLSDSAVYYVDKAMDSHSLTMSIEVSNSISTPLPFPEGATKEQVLDVLTLLEARLDNPAASALCALTLNWYVATLSPRETAGLGERIRGLIERTANSYPYAYPLAGT